MLLFAKYIVYNLTSFAFNINCLHRLCVSQFDEISWVVTELSDNVKFRSFRYSSSNAVSNVYLHNWKARLTTKCLNNVIMVSRSGRKINTQIKTYQRTYLTYADYSRYYEYIAPTDWGEVYHIPIQCIPRWIRNHALGSMVTWLGARDNNNK